MPMRLSGLMSGMDTESIISQLVEARKTKVTKAVKAQKSLKFKQDAWKDLNKKIVNLYNKSLTQMRFEGSYVKKVTKVSNSNIVSVITGEGAMNSVQNLEVKELAKSGFLTGGKLQLWDTDKDEAKAGTVTGSTKLSELGYTGDKGTLELKVGDETKRITVDGNSTVSNFVSVLRSAGVNANFDEGNGRIYISSKTSGKDANFELYGVDELGFDALDALKLTYEDKDGKLEAHYTSISTRDNDKTIEDREAARQKSYQQQWEKYRNNRAGLVEGFSSDMIDKLNGQLSSIAGFQLSYDADDGVKLLRGGKTYSLSDIDKETWGESAWDKITIAINKTQSELAEIQKDENASEADKKAALDLEKSLNGWVANEKNLKAVEDNLVTDAKGKVQLDADGKVQLSDDVKKSIKDTADKEVKDANDMLKKLEDMKNNSSEAAIKSEGSDAVILLNGEEYTSEKNTFEINGLTLTVSAKTNGDPVTITTEDDTNGIYDMIKNFFKEYNAVINEMDKYYNADAAKGYDPLTDEEKAAMSDSQIEEWENKIKDAILRKDSTLSTFSGVMKQIMMEGVEVNGKKMYLSNFGIGTLSYFSAPDNERNAYHIDGDPDDENTANNADKLKSMIANDPDTVVSFFTQLSQKLSDKMFDMMKAKEGYSSAMTVYDDKKMQKDYDDYTAKIKDLEKKLADYEDKWYAKFAAMETALAKMQNNASAVTSLLGG